MIEYWHSNSAWENDWACHSMSHFPILFSITKIKINSIIKRLFKWYAKRSLFGSTFFSFGVSDSFWDCIVQVLELTLQVLVFATSCFHFIYSVSVSFEGIILFQLPIWGQVQSLRQAQTQVIMSRFWNTLLKSLIEKSQKWRKDRDSNPQYP